ncbi:FAD-binding oxidoreductase [Roseisolibacter sp. H3M3-2]|uniref:NAD(P)/FAD-dependent oxidoreductase n=1 Tax=Roseisolibacter sp. H3M3-2 TaxID=3031323 RepID=UPI0023DB6D0A|nr:FAD-binding oxidoreductase [Roseisolibacter sp. H3M3-2]MDF1503168.1 FAD-binding oxidoreductase [Roseisolibacter sp. H3M3-2]
MTTPALPNRPVWDEGPAPELPALAHDVEADVCVVGLGGSGLAAVHELLALGRSVVGLDAGVVGGAAAGRNGGFLLAGPADFHHDAVAKHGRDRAVRMYHLTLAEIDRMIGETPEAIRRVGSIRLAASDEEVEDCRVQLDAMRADGLAAEWYEGPLGTGLRIPTDCAFQPMARARALAARAAERGARLFERSAAVEIAGAGPLAAGGTVRCRAVVVAVDGALDRLLPELAPRIRSTRLQMLATAPTREVSVPGPVYARYGFDYWQQLPDGRISLGGCRDLDMENEWGHDATPTPTIQAALDRVLRERVGVREAPVTHRWAAVVGYTDDGLPVFAEARPGVWAVGAYSGTGNVVGALCGRAAARRAVGLPSEMAALLV